LLVFECNDPVRQQAALDSRALLPAKELPRGMDAARGVLLEAPEGTLLWSLPSRV
jgi:hypothetical protein